MTNKKNISSGERDEAWERDFIRIFQQHECKLHTLALRLTKSDQYAKDIVQDVFLSLWSQQDQIDNIRNIEAWLYRITENKVIDFLRKAAVNERLKHALYLNLREIIHNDTEDFIQARECESIIRTAINSLSPQRKLIYEMNREKGLSYQEIADELRVSRHTVKNQLSSALQSIRQFLNRSRPLVIFFLIFF
jgi:RNA polymerase sigma-70 factor (ECF subfamily)